MRCFVTGASGFIGANLVHELNARGHEVVALVRPGADLRGLEGAGYQAVTGDLSSADLLARAMKDCQAVFHVAASYHLWLPDYAPMYEANVRGVGNVIEAALKAGVPRIVHTSTVGCIGLPGDAGGKVIPTDETATATEGEMTNHYKRSKFQAERLVMEWAAKGAPVVIVNPSAPIGPRDTKPTPTGKIIVSFLNRALPAFLDTGLNWVHVRDVAIGHILAAERGKVGERYILGSREGNWTLEEAFQRLEKLTGIKAPRLRIPYWMAASAAHLNENFSSITGKPPKAPVAGVRMAKSKMFFDPSKAIRELGLPQTPPEQALADAVEWFRANGYAKKANGSC